MTQFDKLLKLHQNDYHKFSSLMPTPISSGDKSKNQRDSV